MLCYLPNASPIKHSCCRPVQDVLFAAQASRKNGSAVGTMMANVTLKAAFTWDSQLFFSLMYMHKPCSRNMCAEASRPAQWLKQAASAVLGQLYICTKHLKHCRTNLSLQYTSHDADRQLSCIIAIICSVLYMGSVTYLSEVIRSLM